MWGYQKNTVNKGKVVMHNYVIFFCTDEHLEI